MRFSETAVLGESDSYRGPCRALKVAQSSKCPRAVRKTEPVQGSPTFVAPAGCRSGLEPGDLTGSPLCIGPELRGPVESICNWIAMTHCVEFATRTQSTQGKGCR